MHGETVSADESVKPTITRTDEGKAVVDGDGTSIGRVAAVADGAAFVEPVAGLSRSVKARLGWLDLDGGPYPLTMASIRRITDDELRLRATGRVVSLRVRT